MDVQADRPTNYRKIARLSGVGKTTVGRVLQGHGSVSEQTRKRVLDAAALLGYRPDPSLAALSRRRWPNGARPGTATLAWVFTITCNSSLPPPPEYLGAQLRARELGYTMDAFHLSDYPNTEALSRVLHTRGIRGVLIQAHRDGAEVKLDWPLFFAVFVGPENDIAHVHNVQADFRAAMHHGVSACRERGYKRIGIALMNYKATGTNIPFRAQALYEHEQLELLFGKQPPIFDFDPEQKDSHAFLGWFRDGRPEVVVSNTILPYYHLTMPKSRERRFKPRRIPEDVAFICLRGAKEVDGLTHMDLREYEQGQQAVDLTHQRLQQGEIGRPEIPLRLLVPPEFVPGQTLPFHLGKKRCSGTSLIAT